MKTPRPNLRDIIAFLKRDHGIDCGKQLTLGNVVTTVFRARRGDEQLVVKIGLAESAEAEVRRNIEGYQNVRAIGAAELLPNPLEIFSYDDIPMLVMQDCGDDFWHAVRISKEPVELYRKLVTRMEDVYRRTKRQNNNTDYFKPLHLLLIEQYRKHISALIDQTLTDRLETASLDSLTVPAVCFSSFDFTPEDVFVTETGVKYLDPLPDVLGVPTLDLACFADVARDAYDLPGAHEGYEIISEFAYARIPIILDCSEACSKQYFLFGRALQSALSARARIASEPSRAKTFAAQSEKFLLEFLNRL